MSARFGRVAVLGLGLIGGSFALALKQSGLAGRIVGYAPAPDGDQAQALGLVDEAMPTAAAAVAGADLVMLAAPVTQFASLLADIAAHAPSDVLISDCASTKRSVLAMARAALGERARQFVAGHPIAGSERSGPTAARDGLFNGAQVMVCPAPETDAGACERIAGLWRALGAHVVLTDVDRHDRLYGELSHWPHAVAFALSSAVAGGEFADEALRFAGAGLRDTTRIGASSPTLWADILLDNRDAVLQSAERFAHELHVLTEALRTGQRDVLIGCLEQGSDWRRRLG